MAVSSRKVQNKRDSNGVLTGKAGTVYDVNIKYTGQDGKKKSYAKKGFATKKEATQHEAEMKAKLANPVYTPGRCFTRQADRQRVFGGMGRKPRQG